MKKIVLISLLLGIMISLSGCGQSSKSYREVKLGGYDECKENGGVVDEDIYPEECKYNGELYINKSQVIKTESMGKKYVMFKTNKGDIKIELDGDKAPITVSNFMNYVNNSYYNGLIFHRVIDGFMIQGGGFDENMNEKPTKDMIKNEASNGLKNNKYTIAMARTGEVDSATSQFFINTVDNDDLNYSQINPGYAVFGKVIEGSEVVDSISKVETGSKAGHSDVPIENVVISEAYEIDSK